MAGWGPARASIYTCFRTPPKVLERWRTEFGLDLDLEAESGSELMLSAAPYSVVPLAWHAPAQETIFILFQDETWVERGVE